MSHFIFSNPGEEPGYGVFLTGDQSARFAYELFRNNDYSLPADIHIVPYIFSGELWVRWNMS